MKRRVSGALSRLSSGDFALAIKAGELDCRMPSSGGGAQFVQYCDGLVALLSDGV
jgi:hypothetical protein